MPDWLKTVTDVLDRAERPVQVFFRDDDAGWSNDRLFGLLDVFAQAAVPIDVAVIPGAIDPMLVDELLTRWQQGKHLIGLHQHGYRHTNHEIEDRKSEFGRYRTKSQQKANIVRGREDLFAAFGNALEFFFTPPWNRCTQETVECLEELNFQLLSRDVTAVKLESSILRQVPVNIDWSKMIKLSADPLPGLGQTIATSLEQNALTGIMLHHADMDNGTLQPLAELLAIFANHNNAQGLLLSQTLG
jgi:predicted deacetylase